MPARGSESEQLPKRLVIFGGASFAVSVAADLAQDGEFEPVAFTVDRGHRVIADPGGRPVVTFDEVADRFPPDRNQMLVALGGHRMMRTRAERCDEARAIGYRLAGWVSSRATVWSDLDVGPNTLVFPGSVVSPFVRLGEDVFIRSNVVVSHHVTVDDHTTIAHGAVLGGGAVVGRHCWIGLGAVVRDGVRVAEGCLIGAGAVVVADTEPDGIYLGVPARRVEGDPSEAIGA